MYRFSNYYRSSFLLVGLVAAGACVCGKLWAGDPRNGPEVKGEQTSSAPEKLWGSVQMRFVVDDPRTRGEAVAAHHSDVPPVANDETLVIDAGSHGIRNVVVLVRHVSRVHQMYAHVSGQPAVLKQDDNRFVPHVLPVMVGQQLRIHNDSATRQVAMIRHSQGRGLDLLMAPGEQAMWRFTQADFLPAQVSIASNSSMKAYAVVVDNPYVAVSDDQGMVVLTNVPAGEELDLRIWHERSGWLTFYKGDLRIVVPADGLLDFGEVYIPAADLANSRDFDRTKQVAH